MTRGHQVVAELAHRITAAEMAHRAGTSPSMIRHVAAGRKTPGADLRARLVPLGVPLESWARPADAPAAEPMATAPFSCAGHLAEHGLTPGDFLEILEVVLAAKPEIANALADAFRELHEVAHAIGEAPHTEARLELLARYGA